MITCIISLYLYSSLDIDIHQVAALPLIERKQEHVSKDNDKGFQTNNLLTIKREERATTAGGQYTCVKMSH